MPHTYSVVNERETCYRGNLMRECDKVKKYYQVGRIGEE